MESIFGADPSYRKANRKVRNAIPAVVAVAALALAGCSTSHAEHKPSTPTAASAPAKPNVSPKTNAEVAFEQAREAQVEQVKLAAVNAANKILAGLERSGAEAKNYASDNPYVFGNAWDSDRTKAPETTFRFYADSNALIVMLLAEKADDPNAPGNHLDVEVAFRVGNPSIITSAGKLTPSNLKETLSHPSDLGLIGADTSTVPLGGDANTSNASGSSLTVYGNEVYTSDYSWDSFGSFVGPLAKPGEPGYGLRGTQITSIVRLSEVTSRLNEQLNSFSDRLAREF